MVGIIVGSKSDCPMMEYTTNTLDALSIPHEQRVLSVYRAPDALSDYLKSLEDKGIQVIIAAAGGAAHLPGIIASATLLPVIGVPMASSLNGLDALLSMVQMPTGVPVATMAIGKVGAINAALYAASILSLSMPKYRDIITDYRQKQVESILA